MPDTDQLLDALHDAWTLLCDLEVPAHLDDPALDRIAAIIDQFSGYA